MPASPDFIAELVRERFGAGVPWREHTAGRRPPHPPADDELAIQRRRRLLCEALDDVTPTYRRGRRAA